VTRQGALLGSSAYLKTIPETTRLVQSSVHCKLHNLRLFPLYIEPVQRRIVGLNSPVVLRMPIRVSFPDVQKDRVEYHILDTLFKENQIWPSGDGVLRHLPPPVDPGS
jgi:hypothetical protein